MSMDMLHPMYAPQYFTLTNPKLLRTFDEYQRYVLTKRLGKRRNFIFRGLPTVYEEDEQECSFDTTDSESA